MPEMITAPHWHRPDRVKRCVRCGEDKTLGEFYAYGYVTQQGKDSTRYESRCRPCARERRREACAADPVKQAAISKKWRNKNLAHCQAKAAEYRSTPHGRAMKAKAQRLRKARMRSGQGDNAAIRSIYAQAIAEEILIAHCPVFDLPELGHKLHVDHVMPLSKGGAHHEKNLQILPIGLNMRKGVTCRN